MNTEEKKYAELYIQGEVKIGELLYTDSKTYTTPCHVFYVSDLDTKIAVFDNGDKFKRWI